MTTIRLFSPSFVRKCLGLVASGIVLLACVSVSAQSQSDMNQEAARNAEKADAELNQVYRKLMSSLDAEGVKLLKEAQRAWITYRDAEAKRAGDEARGGSMSPMLYDGAVAALTKERIKRLQSSISEDKSVEKRIEKQKEKPIEKDLPKAIPVKKPERIEPLADNGPDGAKTQAQASQLFFDAYKAHNRKAAEAIAESSALDRLVWSKSAGDAESLRLMDTTHIYYEGGHIELKLKQNQGGRWIVSDVKLYAD